MSKTVQLRAALTKRLQEACPRVHYGRVTGEVIRPYIVYTVETLLNQDGRQSMQMEVNVVDKSQDTTTCEEIADQVESLFDHWLYLDDTIQLAAWNNKRQPVEEEDSSIVRRRLLIDINFYERRRI